MLKQLAAKVDAWMPGSGLLAQISHFFIGTTLVLAFPAIGIKEAWYGLYLTIAWAVPKEFVFDLLVEKDSWDGGMVDFCFYLLGAGAALWYWFLFKE